MTLFCSATHAHEQNGNCILQVMLNAWSDIYNPFPALWYWSLSAASFIIVHVSRKQNIWSILWLDNDHENCSLESPWMNEGGVAEGLDNSKFSRGLQEMKDVLSLTRDKHLLISMIWLQLELRNNSDNLVQPQLTDLETGDKKDKNENHFSDMSLRGKNK